MTAFDDYVPFPNIGHATAAAVYFAASRKTCYKLRAVLARKKTYVANTRTVLMRSLLVCCCLLAGLQPRVLAKWKQALLLSFRVRPYRYCCRVQHPTMAPVPVEMCHDPCYDGGTCTSF